MEHRHIAFTLAAAGVSVVVNLAVADTAWLWPWWVLAPGLAVLSVTLGVRRHRPVNARPWLVLIVALTIMWAGWSMSAWIGADLGDSERTASVALVRDLLYIVGYPLLGLASLMMVRARTGGRDRDNLIDALIIMVALATTLGAWLFGATSLATIPDSTDRLWITIAPLLLAAVVTASLRLLMAGAGRLPAAWLIVVSSIVALAGNAWAAQLLRHGVAVQTTGIDVLWVLGFVAVSAAALHPSMREMTEPVDRSALVQGMPIDRLALLGAALLAAPFAHLRMSGGDAPETLPVVTGGVLVAVLAVWRVSRLLRERDVAREALAHAAARDAIVATVSRWALEDHSIWELVAETDEVLADAVPGVACAVVPDQLAPTTLAPEAITIVVDDGTHAIAHVVAEFGEDRTELDGERGFLVAIATILSAAARRRETEARLRHDALHDPLTGLPNRTLARDRLDQLLSRRDVAVSAVFLDLDGFKVVNDTLGHEAGDTLLSEVAGRLRQVVREDDTVARLAGDEFLLLVNETERGPLVALVERVLDAATVEVVAVGQPLRVTASIGVATSTAATSSETLLRRADQAMYRAKRAGGRSVAWADDAPDPDSRDAASGPPRAPELTAAG